MPDVKVLVEVIGGTKLVATIDSSSTAQAAAEVLSGLVQRPLVDENGKKKNWKLFAPGKRGNIAPLMPHASLSVSSDWAASVAGTNDGGFAGPGEHDGEAYAFRVRFFVPKPPPPKKEKVAAEPIDEEEALDLTDMVEIDALESVRHVPEPEPPKKKKRRRKRAPGEAATGEIPALKRAERASGAIPIGAAATGEKKRRKRKKRADTGEMQAHPRPSEKAQTAPPTSTPEETEKTVRSDPGEATVRTEPAPAKVDAPAPEAAPATMSKAEAARANVEAARARVEAAKAAAAKAVADAAAAAAEAAAAEAAAEKAAAEKAAAEKAAAEKAAAEAEAAETAARKARLEKAAAEKAAAERARADEAAAEKAAEEKAAADKAAAEKAAADKAAADNAAAEKAAADKEAADKAAAAQKAANKASTSRVVAISPVTEAAPEPGQQPVTAKTRQLTRLEASEAIGQDPPADSKAEVPPALGSRPMKKDSNTGLFIALAVLLVVAAGLGYALLTRDKGDGDSDPAPRNTATSAPRLSEDLRITAYSTGEGDDNDAVSQAVKGYTSLNTSTAADLKDADVRRKAGMVAEALETQCNATTRFDACEAWARVSYALYAGCADGGCDGKEQDLLIQRSIVATDLALSRGVLLADPKAKGSATRLLVAHAIRLGSQNQKLVAAKAPRVAALGLTGCSGSASGTLDCQALTRTQ